jgi:hypothetical protein
MRAIEVILAAMEEEYFLSKGWTLICLAGRGNCFGALFLAAVIPGSEAHRGAGSHVPPNAIAYSIPRITINAAA